METTQFFTLSVKMRQALLSLKPSNCLKEMFRAAVNFTVKLMLRQPFHSASPCLSWQSKPCVLARSLARSSLLSHAVCRLHSSTQCSFFQAIDLQIRPEDSMSPFVTGPLSAGASHSLTLSSVGFVTCLLQLPLPCVALTGLRRSVVCRVQDGQLAPSLNDVLGFLSTLLFPTVTLSDGVT